LPPECSWKAIEDAGWPAGKLRGAAIAPAAGRIVYRFGWEGPALAVDAACSGSRAAFHPASRDDARRAETGFEFLDRLEPDDPAARIEQDLDLPGAQ
jgi:hypothetical protein